MKRIGRADDVVMYVHSEFGRRVPENTSLGTDHGTAQVNFVIGNAVKGGLYGKPPSLTNLVLGDNLESTTDFRRVYATLIEEWMGADAAAVLGQKLHDDGHVPGVASRSGGHDGHSHRLVAGAGGLEGRPDARSPPPTGTTTAPRICWRTPASAARRPRSRSWPTPGLERAVRSLVHYESIPNPTMQPFVESGLWDPTLNGFPESRPEATDRAEKHGSSMGVENKPSGNRPVQPVSDRFFYWLRATMLETRRLGYWWANRMLQTTHPVEQKMALLWHGHFATHENKVRDYRKMLQQIELFERGATGNLRDLTIQVAQNPAMLYFLDAQYNVKGAPNENFAREVMELFTMGVGNYSENDVRECARAFTGWYFDNLAFKVDPAKHDAGPKTFLGRTGNFDGVDVLKIIFEQPVTAEYLAGKIYRFLVRDELSPELRKKLGAVLRDHDYEVKPLLTVIFSSKDFYSQASYGGHIKGPVEHLVAMLKHLGVDAIPGCPTSISRPSRWASTC